MNRSARKLAEAVRGSLRAAAYSGSEQAMRDYAPDLAGAGDDLVADLAAAGREVARVSREHSPGAARRVVDELLPRLDEKYRLTERPPTRAERDQADALAARIVAGSSPGLNTAEDTRRQAAARAARERVDDALGGHPVPWKQD